MLKQALRILSLIVVCCGVVPVAAAFAATPTTTFVSNTGWRLWLDPKAPWQNDMLYLPDELNLSALPVNAPTGGWETLDKSAGIAISLPGTVEEHYWGKAPARVINPNDPSDAVNGNGEYLGVSWWYRTFTPPTIKPGEHLVFSFPGARMRAEVYVNGKLCGYDAVTETPFTADATDAVKPGQPNLLAVRITNPGGNFDWGDFDTIKWGKYDIPISHGFGGLDGGVAMNLQAPVAVTDLAVLNNPDPKTITFEAQITSTGEAYDGPVALSVARGGKIIWTGNASAYVPAGGQSVASTTVTIPKAELWDIGKPALYEASAAIPSLSHSDRRQSFGFRWFTATGVGRNASLKLNGRRIVVKSSISWGYWSPNGMFADKAAAERDVASVRKFGLNAIQNHRHMPKQIVSDAYDQAGLLGYAEAGAGCFTFSDPPANLPGSGPVDTSGKGGEPTTFANKYELYKVLAMIKAGRSHPSAIIWSLQNEVVANHYNPKIYYTLRKMREADPSRIVMLESGFATQDQVWALPYSIDLMVDQGKGSGWNDTHSAGNSRGVYEDRYYKSASDFEYNSHNAAEVLAYGEMATGASPDDHGAMADWYKRRGISGYDQEAHTAAYNAYEDFIGKFGFRSAFHSPDDIFQGAANMHYLMAARMMENARICDATDYIVLSGWESTVRDNHSGMVDSLRIPKTDPALIKAASAPAALVVRAPHYVLPQGSVVSVDVHLLNENILHGSYTLNVAASQDGEKPFYSSSSPAIIVGGETFAQVLKTGITFTPKHAGTVTVTASLNSLDGYAPVLTKSDHLFVVDTHPAPLRGEVAVIGSSQVAAAIQSRFHVKAAPYADASADARTIVIGSVLSKDTAASAGSWSSSTFDKSAIHGSPDPGIYMQQHYGSAGPLASYDHLADGLAKVTLYFVETWWNDPRKRSFDLALNGKTVLKNFDIFQESGGKGNGISKTFDVDIADGQLTVSIPAVQSDKAIISALQITDARGKEIRVVFGGSDFVQADGHNWKSVEKAQFDWSEVPAGALQRVYKDGARMVFLSSAKDASDAQEAASGLAKQSILRYSGVTGDPGPSWLGSWYFGKKSWLLDGLPSNTVLDWQYQITGGNGLEIDAPGIDAVIGYGINHQTHIGLGAAIIPYGKGQIVLFCIPGLAQSFVDGQPEGIDPVTAERIVYNSLAGPGFMRN